MLALAQAYWNLIRGARIWLAITLCLFFLGAAAGVVIGITNPSLIDQVQERIGGGRETGFPALFLILKHNLRVMLITWGGSLVLAITPVVHTIATGFLFGGLPAHGPVSYWLLVLFPHGIVEFPAILLGNAFFLRLGLRWAFQKNASDRKRTFAADLQNSFRIALLCTVLFSVGAMVESFVTPKILAAYEEAHLAGIGVEVAVYDHQPTVTHVFPNSPAAKADLTSGLVIHKIDGKETAGRDLEQCREMTHGPVGSKVRLEVIDTVRNQTNIVELVRELKP